MTYPSVARTSRVRRWRPGWSTRSTCSSHPSRSGGTPALPDHLRSNLELLDVDRFAGGVVHLRYRTIG